MRTRPATRNSRLFKSHPPARRGTVIILAAVMMFVVLGIAAFTVDYGMLTVTKGQLQNAADSAAHAAMQELLNGLGPGAMLTPGQAAEEAGNDAVNVVNDFRSGDTLSTQLNVNRDIRFGRRSWDSGTSQWVKEWGTSPYNMVEVTVRRTSAAGTPLGGVFSGVFGKQFFDIEARAVASVTPASGFTRAAGSTADVLPIALDITTWSNLLGQMNNGVDQGFKDQYRFDSSNNSVHSGSDSISEVNIYPHTNSSLPSGNRGTVDFGSSNNSTADLKRQIENGLNDYDLSFFPNNEIKLNDQGILNVNGDTGISAGIESSLQSIVGKVRAIPLFISVSGPGNNAQYTIVKFVGVRIMAVKLTGGPTQRYVRVQPALYSSRSTIRKDGPMNVDSILSKPLLIE